jgi:hypothetical protein
VKQKNKSNLERWILTLSAIVLFTISAPRHLKASSLEDIFLQPEHQGSTITVACRFLVPDTSPDWSKILLAGFVYAFSSSEKEEMIAVAIKEQDGFTHVYSVRKSDFQAFIDDRISMYDFTRKIRMNRMR